MIWKGCERLGIRPPEVKPSWDDCDVITQHKILAYSQICDDEEFKLSAQLAGADI